MALAKCGVIFVLLFPLFVGFFLKLCYLSLLTHGNSQPNITVAFSDLQGPLALEALSQQQAARLGQWGEMSGTFLQDNIAFPLPQQLAHLAQTGMVRFPPQLLRANSWGLGASMDDEAIVSASPGPPFARLV